MTVPGQPQTCSHLIYALPLTGVQQAVRYFLLAIFHASISIGALESASLSLSTPSRNGLNLIKWQVNFWTHLTKQDHYIKDLWTWCAYKN